MAEEVKSKEFTTALSVWNKTVTNAVSGDFKSIGVPFDDYSKTCASNAMCAVYDLAVRSNVNLKEADMNSLVGVVKNAASLKLNYNMGECYFQIRKKNIRGKYVDTFEFGVQGKGNEAMLRNFGVGVKKVYSPWLVMEGDDFTYPKRKGMRMEPPEWTPKGLSNKCVRVVYPLLLADDEEEYLIAERDQVTISLFVHVRQNLLNETFGICPNIYKATAEQKEKIKEKKEPILEALRACKTVDEMLACEVARPYMSLAWLDTPESMIQTKMRNKAIKPFPKDLNPIAKESLLMIDEVYKARKEEEAIEANSVEFVPEDEETVVVEGEVVVEPSGEETAE